MAMEHLLQKQFSLSREALDDLIEQEKCNLPLEVGLLDNPVMLTEILGRVLERR
jgi:hypothetical protein